MESPPIPVRFNTGLFSSESLDEQFERLRVAQTQVLNLTSWAMNPLKSPNTAGYRSGQIISSQNAFFMHTPST